MSKKKVAKLKLEKQPTMSNGQPFPSTDRKKILLRHMLDAVYEHGCSILDEEEEENSPLNERGGPLTLILCSILELDNFGNESFKGSEKEIISIAEWLKDPKDNCNDERK